DYLAFGMDILFCGINPGLKSSEKGHYFAGHQNCFWKYLCGSGLVSGDIDCTFDHLLPAKYNYGLTNLVKRVTRSSSDLTTQDYKTGVPILMNKVLRYKPRILCFVGKQIYQMFLKNGGGNSSEKNFRWGLQPERIGYLSYDLIKKEDEESEVKQEKIDIGWNSTSIFVMPSTSARTASIQQVEKLVFFQDLK
ncbi:uracil-DNA glycosylase-like protein, partial [Paraphysoderma sedebokerense]